jgi:hypothetical protein
MATMSTGIERVLTTDERMVLLARLRALPAQERAAWRRSLLIALAIQAVLVALLLVRKEDLPVAMCSLLLVFFVLHARLELRSEFFRRRRALERELRRVSIAG